MKTFTSVALCFAQLLSVVSSTCYFPNGNETNDVGCSDSATGSACCGPGYACLSNNLCALTEHVDAAAAKGSPFYVRAGCTDKTWTGKDCPKFCRNATNGDNLGLGGMGVGRCDGEGQVNRFYCRNTETAEMSNTDLCSSKQYYFEFPGFPTTVTVIGQEASSTPDPSSDTSTSASPTPSTSPTSSPSPSSSATADQGNNKEKALGLGLGLGLGIPLLVVLGLALFLSLGRRKQSYSASELDATQGLTAGETGHGVHSWGQQWSKHSAPGELSNGMEHVSEVPASQQAFELQNSQVAHPGAKG